MSENQSTPTRERLSNAKLALLEKRLGRSFSEVGAVRHIPRRPLKERAPLSFQQQRQWLLLEREGLPSFYNNVVRLTGDLDALAFSRAFDEVVSRHEILRTTFVVEDGRPVQFIHPPQESNMAFVDLSGLPEAEREARAAQLSEEQARPFDLARGPVFRAALVRLEEHEHLLLFTLLHLVSDRWSIKVLTQEMGAIYHALAAGKPAPLPELPIQYGDYALWQRQLLEEGESLRQELPYWLAQLQGCPPVLPLQTDNPRPPLQTFRGAHESLMLPQELSESLKALSRREGATLFMTMLAVLKVLLSLCTGREDIAVATGIAGRQQGETERLIGCFINTLVIRTSLAGDPTFKELLSRVREVALGAYAHQEMPFQKLVEELLPAPDPRYPPLVQVSFALHNAAREEATPAEGLRMSLSAVDAHRAAFDLTLRVQETTQGMICTLEYNADLFHPATVTKMLENYRRLSERVAERAEQRLSDLTLEC
jgi:hypothetical protein